MDFDMKGKACAYCGKTGQKLTRDHVIPRGIYPASKADSKVQRLTVPACDECNNAFSVDEAHFRDVLLIAGEPNDSVRELWDTTARRSFDKPDGPQRLDSLFSVMMPINVNGKDRHIVYPGNDERVMRVIRKIVRGMCHHHSVLSPVSDSQVMVDVLKYVVPQEFLGMMQYHHREEDICEYKYAVLPKVEINSIWLLTFFQRTTFIAGVLSSNDSYVTQDIEE